MREDQTRSHVTQPEAPGARLPHAYPFLLLDRVLGVEPGRWAAAVKRLSRDDALLDDDGALPPILLAEAMAQAAGLAVSAPPGTVALLIQIDRFRSRGVVAGGTDLLVTARVLRRFGRNLKVRASVRAAGRRRAACELVLHFPDSAAVMA